MTYKNSKILLFFILTTETKHNKHKSRRTWYDMPLSSWFVIRGYMRLQQTMYIRDNNKMRDEFHQKRSFETFLY